MYSMSKLSSKNTMAHDDVTYGGIAGKIFQKINDLATQIELTGNFNATILKLAEKFGHPLTHLFLFGNMFAQGHSHRLEIFHLCSLIKYGEFEAESLHGITIDKLLMGILFNS